MLDQPSERITARAQAAERRNHSWLWWVSGALLVALDLWAFQAAGAVWAQVLFGLLSGAALVWAVIRPDRQT
jgi:hypothetical protein